MNMKLAGLIAVGLVCCALPLAADSKLDDMQVHEDWFSMYVKDSDSVVAATINDSGAILRVACGVHSSECYWQIRSETMCDVGKSFPVLINASDSAFSASVYCEESSTKISTYTIDKFDSMSDIAMKSAKIGFAFPLEDDRFTVVRFSLKGSSAAITRAINLSKKKAASSTKNQNI